MIANYETAVRGHPAIAPVSAHFTGKAGVQRKATACQRIERIAGAPIEGQEPTRFAGSCPSHLCTFNNNDINAGPSQEVSGASSDHPAAANHITHLLLREVSGASETTFVDRASSAARTARASNSSTRKRSATTKRRSSNARQVARARWTEAVSATRDRKRRCSSSDRRKASFSCSPTPRSGSRRQSYARQSSNSPPDTAGLRPP